MTNVETAKLRAAAHWLTLTVDQTNAVTDLVAQTNAVLATLGR